MIARVLDAPPANNTTTEQAQPSVQSSHGGTSWLVGGAILLFIGLGFTLFRSTGQDDCYLSYWPAHTLATFGRIVNYNGEAVEQSSSLLWVLAMGLIAFISRQIGRASCRE